MYISMVIEPLSSVLAINNVIIIYLASVASYMHAMPNLSESQCQVELSQVQLNLSSLLAYGLESSDSSEGWRFISINQHNHRIPLL